MRIYLQDLREDAGLALDESFERFDSSQPSAHIAEEVRGICANLQMIAVATLLLEADAQVFFLNLCRAAENWRRLVVFLRTRSESLPRTTFNAPLLGAMVANHWELAQALACTSGTAWQEDEEYEDDFTWALLLQEWLVSSGEGPRLKTLEARVEEIGDDFCKERLSVLRRLRARDAESFLSAFERARGLHQETTERMATLSTIPVAEFAPHRYVWLEGLALLRLAERAGLQVRGPFLYCPPLARLPCNFKYQADEWVVPLAVGEENL